MKNLFTIGCALLVLLVILSVSSPLFAQEQNIEEQIGLRIKELDKALNLNDNQEAQIRKIYSDAMAQMAERFGGDAPPRGGGMMMFRGRFGRFGQTDSAIEAVLTPEQVEKYRAFNLQQQIEARMALLDETLTLTNEQKTKIRKIIEQDIQASNKMFAEMQESEGDRQSMFEKMRTRREEVNKAIEAVLTPEQIEKYRSSLSMGRRRM